MSRGPQPPWLACTRNTLAYRVRVMSEAEVTGGFSSPEPPALPAELADWPVCTLGEAQLGDLELLTSGAFAPLHGFMDAAELGLAERARRPVG